MTKGRREARNVGLLLLLGALGLIAAFQYPGEIFFDFGPNDARYVRGFREDFEVDEPTIIHWSSNRARVRLPLYLRGPFDVTLRYKRHIAAPAAIRVFVGGVLSDRFTVPQSDFSLRTFHVSNETPDRFSLLLLSHSDDPRPLGLALDWMLIRPSAGPGRVLPDARALLWMLSWVLGAYAALRLLGFSATAAFRFGIGTIAALAAMAVSHKLWPVHAALVLGLRAHVIAFALIGFYVMRRCRPGSAFTSPEARFALVFVYVGLAVRLFALFHPDFYYPDVRTHSKFVSLIWTEGLSGFFTDYIASQHRHLLGLQLVGEKWLAFPYPPLLYLTIYPLSRLQLPVEDWMKLVPTALAGVEALVLFAVAGKLGIRPRAAAIAVALHASARVLVFRLAVASYAALFGHFWDVVAIAYLTFCWDRIAKPRYAAGFGVLVTISLLSYAGSALVLGMFVPALGLACLLSKPRRSRKRLLAVELSALASALAAAVLFYAQYVPELLLHPGSAAGSVSAGALIELELTPLAALRMALHRMDLFYGWVFTGLAALALVFQRNTIRHVLAMPLVVATLATFLGLNFLRSGLGATHIFQFSKDDLVVLPLVVLVLGILFARLFGTARGGYVAAALIAGWVVWGGLGLARDVRSRFIRPGYPPPVSALGQDAKTTRLPPLLFASYNALSASSKSSTSSRA